MGVREPVQAGADGTAAVLAAGNDVAVLRRREVVPMTSPVVIRAAVVDDFPFVTKAWRATMQYAHGSLGADPDHFLEEMRRVFAKILPNATVRIACDAKDSDNLVGFAILTDDELHYTYVAADYRRAGVVPDLLKGLTIKRYTFITPQGERRLKPRERGWKYTPRYTL